jgi:hypothetical protein
VIAGLNFPARSAELARNQLGITNQELGKRFLIRRNDGMFRKDRMIVRLYSIKNAYLCAIKGK